MELLAQNLGSAQQTKPPSFARGLVSYPRPNLLVLLVFLAFVVARYISVNERMDLLRAVRMEFLLGLMSTVFAIVKLSTRPPAIEKSRQLVFWMVALFIAIALQVPFAADQIYAPRVFSDRVFKFSLFALLIAALVDSPFVMKAFLGAFLFSIFYITLESTEGLISGGLYWENQGVMRLHGAVSQYGHPNSLGGVALGSLPFVIFLFTPIKNWILRMGLLATAATSMVCVIYSGSRTAYVGLFSLVAWFLFHQKNKMRAGAIILAVGLGALLVVPNQYIQRFESIAGQEEEGGSKVARIQIIKDAVVVFSENPLGIGVSSFPVVRYKRFGRSQDTHNLYLEVATNLGIQGLIVFVGFVTTMMITFRRVAFDFQAQEARILRAGRASPIPAQLKRQLAAHYQDLRFLVAVAQAGAGFILVRLVLGAFGMDMYEIYWWFGSGLAISLSGLAVAARKRTNRLLAMLELTAETPSGV